MTDVRDRLKRLRKLGDFKSLKQAAERYGIGYESYKKIGTAADRNLTVEQAIAIANHHRVSAGWLMFGEGSPKGEFSVPLRGYIGAGQEMTWFDELEENETVTALITSEGMAFEVRGDSMLPLARPGDVAFFAPPTRDRRGIKRLIGQECAVVLQDGRKMFKVIERSATRDDRYDLHSYNASAQTIREVEIHEAGQFLGLRRK